LRALDGIKNRQIHGGRRDAGAGADDDKRQRQGSRRELLSEGSQNQRAESRCKMTAYQCAERSEVSKNHRSEPRSDPEPKRQGQKQHARADRRQPVKALKREAQDEDEAIDSDVVKKPHQRNGPKRPPTQQWQREHRTFDASFYRNETEA
jgi:hypothetical protein